MGDKNKLKELLEATKVGGVRRKGHKRRSSVDKTKVLQEKINVNSTNNKQKRQSRKSFKYELPLKQHGKQQQRKQINSKIQQPTPTYYFSKETPFR